ncbi:PRC-barrel domain-containing protein [Streptomyces sp. NPDC006510]|uniref:PRC-barrel domain-containing protein n=1 Tax=Streptomyces sp. NPDC006510 TaxID=3155600 RepID=UPI0033BCE1F5
MREWWTDDVVDTRGRRIGELEAIHVDTSTDESAMAAIRVGLPTRHRLVFVPPDGATVGPGYVKVAHDQALVKQCPSIGTEGILPAEDEEAVFRHYGLAHRPGANG